MKIHQCMKHNVVSIRENTTIREAARMFVAKHIGCLPVVDAQGVLVGLLQLRDLLELVLPDFVNLVTDFDFAPDFGAVETRTLDDEILARPVSNIMHPPIAVDAQSGVIRAYSLLHKHQLHDLPVVDAEKHLVGIASRVDIGAAFVSKWNITQGGG